MHYIIKVEIRSILIFLSIMRQFFGADVRKQTGNFFIGHGVALGEIAHACAHFSVGTAILGHDDGGKFGIGFLDIYREL